MATRTRIRLAEDPPSKPPTVVGFNYDAVSPEIAKKLRGTAERVHKLAEHILDIGRELRDRREDCFSGGQGKNAGIWGAWLLGEFAMDRRTALRYIAAADLVDRLDTLSNLGPTSLYMLAAAPPTAVDEVAERLEAGETLTGKDVAAIIAERKKKASELKAKVEKRKTPPIDLERGSTFTSNDPHPADKDKPIGRDRSGAAMDAAADEDSLEERWQRNLSAFAADCLALCRAWKANSAEDVSVPPETVADLKKAFAALADLATGLGIEPKKARGVKAKLDAMDDVANEVVNAVAEVFDRHKKVRRTDEQVTAIWDKHDFDRIEEIFARSREQSKEEEEAAS